MCAHREAAYENLPPRVSLSSSEEAQDRRIVLPLYPQMTADEQDLVISALREACRQ